MAVVAAFSVLPNTINAGVTAYYRATGCTDVIIADVIPLFSKITAYEDEYVIGEMKIWDDGVASIEPNNCVMVRVMVYNDGWVVAWFDKESQNQGSTSGCTFIDGQTLGSFGSFCEYPDKWNGYLLKVTSSVPTDPDCPDDTTFCIRNTDSNLDQIQVHANYDDDYYTINHHFNSGHTYTVEIHQNNGNLVWWGHTSDEQANPPTMSNRLYRAIYEMWENLRLTSGAVNNGYANATRGILDDGGTYINYTTAFNNSTSSFFLMPSTEQVNDAFYYGHILTFDGIQLNITHPGIGSAITWEYWNGTIWAALTVTDNTNGFTVSGENTVDFTAPVDWAETIINGENLYWVRSRVTSASYSTYSLAVQGWIYTIAPIDYEDSNLGMYSFEDTGANYCLICGINIYVDEDKINEFFYNTSLPTKTIYKHSISCGAYNFGSSTNTRFFVNDKSLLCTHGSYMVRTNGYIIFDIKTIAGTIAIQNVFNCYGSAIFNSQRMYGEMASVLITS